MAGAPLRVLGSGIGTSSGMAPAVPNMDRQQGYEEGRTNLSSTDPSRRHIFAPAGNTGSSSKQKNPVGGESVVSKEAMLSSLTFFGRSSGSARRAAVSSSRDVMAGNEGEQSRSRATEASPGNFRKFSGPQRSSPVASAEPRRTSSGRHPSNIKTYESTLKGIEHLNFDGNEKYHY